MKMHHMITSHVSVYVQQFYDYTFTPTWVDVLPTPEKEGRARIGCSRRNIYRVQPRPLSHGRQMRPHISAVNYEEEQGPELMMEDKRQAH